MWFRSARLQHCNAFFAQLTTLCNILRGQKPTAIDCNATNRIVKACIMRQNYNCEYEDSHPKRRIDQKADILTFKYDEDRDMI